MQDLISQPMNEAKLSLSSTILAGSALSFTQYFGGENCQQKLV
jgi:hypothetical protein